MTLDAKQSIVAWVSVSLFVGLFSLMLWLDLTRFIPDWVVWTGQGLLLTSFAYRLAFWLWRRRTKKVALNG